MTDEVEENGCQRRQEECLVEEGRATVIRTLTQLCCGSTEETSTEVPSLMEDEAYFIVHSGTGLGLSFKKGIVGLNELKRKDSEKWVLENSRLVSPHFESSLGMENGMFTLVNSTCAMEVRFEGGNLKEKASSRLIVWEDDKLKLSGV